MLTNLTSNTQNNSPLSNENEYEHVKHIYNCDLNYPGELFPPAPMFMIDKSSLTLQQRLEEIVERRDGKMAQVIDGLLREGSPDKRYFIAAGFSKKESLFLLVELNSLFSSSFNGFRWDCNEIETRLQIFSYTSLYR